MSGMQDAGITKITEDKTGYFFVLQKDCWFAFVFVGISHFLFNLSYH